MNNLFQGAQIQGLPMQGINNLGAMNTIPNGYMM